MLYLSYISIEFWSTLVHPIYFCPFGVFGPLWSVWFIHSLGSNLVDFGLSRTNLVSSVHSFSFSPIWSIWPLPSILVHFDLFGALKNDKRQIWVESIYSRSKFIKEKFRQPKQSEVARLSKARCVHVCLKMQN